MAHIVMVNQKILPALKIDYGSINFYLLFVSS